MIRYRLPLLLYIFSLPIISIPQDTLAGNPLIEITDPITLPKALELARDNNPDFLLLDKLAEAFKGQMRQAAVKPNPEFEAEIENVLGTGPFSGLHGMEITLGVSRVFETADKREYRESLAEHELREILWSREQIAAEIESRMKAQFIRVLLAEKVVDLRHEQLALLLHAEVETGRLVEAAHSPQVELTRAQLAVQRHRFIVQQSERELLSEKSVLAALWGQVPAPRFDVSGSIVVPEHLPDLNGLINRLPESVTLRKYQVIHEKRLAALQLEQAKTRQDFEVFAGARFTRENSGDLGFIMGISIPWPRSDLNRGNVESARAMVDAVDLERESVRRNLIVNLNNAYQIMVSAHSEAMTVETHLIPAAGQTLAEVETGYERGQFTQLEVIDSRRTLFELRETYLGALGRLAQATAEIERLTCSAQFQSEF